MSDLPPLRQELILDRRKHHVALQEAGGEMRRFSGDSKRELGLLQQNVDNVAGKIKTALAGAFLFVASQIVGGIGRAVASMARLGSEVNETASKYETVFGGAVERTNRFIEQNAALMGMTRREAQNVLSTAGAIVQGMGAAQDASAEMSERIVQLAADLQSFHNIPIDEAFTAIRAGLVGESEPMRRFGVVVTEADTKVRALAETEKERAEQLSDLEKAQARLNLMVERAGVANGDLERTQDQVANRARRVNAELRQFSEEMAVGVLPSYEEVIRLAETFTEALGLQGETLGGRVSRGLLAVTRQAIDFGIQTGRAAQSVVTLMNAVGLLSDDMGENLLGRIIKARMDDLRGLAGLFNMTAVAIHEAHAAVLEWAAVAFRDPGSWVSAVRARSRAEAIREEMRAQRAADQQRILDRRRVDRELERATKNPQAIADALVQATASAADLAQKIKKAEEATKLAKERAEAWREEFSLMDPFRKGALGDLLGETFDPEIDGQALENVVRPLERLLNLGRFGSVSLPSTLAQARESLQGLREDYENAFTDKQRAEIAEQIRLYEKWIDATDRLGEKTQNVGEFLSSMVDAGRSMLRLAEALGAVSDEIATIAGGALDAVDNLANLARTRERLSSEGVGLSSTTGLLAQLPGIVGALAGVGSIIATMIQAEERSERAMRDLEKALKDNAARVERAIEAAFTGGQVGSDLSEEQLVRAQTLLNMLTTGVVDLDLGQLLLEQLSGSGIPFLEGIDETVMAEFQRLLFDVFLDDVKAGRMGLEDVFNTALRRVIGGSGDFPDLKKAIEELLASLGTFTMDVAGAVDQVRFFAQFLGEDAVASVQRFLDFLLSSVEGLTPELRALLEEAAGLDLTSPEGAARLGEIIALVAKAFESGGSAFLGGLTPDELEQILATLQGFAEALGEDGGAGPAGPESTNAQFVRVATEVQIDRWLAIQEESLYTLRQILSVLSGPSAQGPGPQGPSIYPPSVSALSSALAAGRAPLPSLRGAAAAPSFSASYVYDFSGMQIRTNGALDDRTIREISRVFEDQIRSARDLRKY